MQRFVFNRAVIVYQVQIKTACGLLANSGQYQPVLLAPKLKVDVALFWSRAIESGGQLLME